jgi:hypothetical protein
MAENYTDRAISAITEAVAAEPDFPGWLAGVLAVAAERRGSSYALIAGRSGSWEADLVVRLVRGTVGWDDEYLIGGIGPPVPGLTITEPEDLRTGHPGTGPPSPG